MDDIEEKAQRLVRDYRQQGLRVATAESCTGGMVAAAITAISGSSAVLDRGFVTYSNEAKTEMLGVDEALIHEHGAVSEAVARAMAEGAILHSRADIAVAITGIAGPTGGSKEKPVGLVWFGLARRKTGTLCRSFIFQGDRAGIRRASVDEALTLFLEALG